MRCRGLLFGKQYIQTSSDEYTDNDNDNQRCHSRRTTKTYTFSLEPTSRIWCSRSQPTIFENQGKQQIFIYLAGARWSFSVFLLILTKMVACAFRTSEFGTPVLRSFVPVFERGKERRLPPNDTSGVSRTHHGFC